MDRADLLAAWYAPDYFTVPRCRLDARPGGAIRLDLQGPDGTTYPMTGRFRELTAPQRLSYVATPLDAGGEPLFELLVTASFEPRPAGGTDVAVEITTLSTTPEGAVHLAGLAAEPRQPRPTHGRTPVVTSTDSISTENPAMPTPHPALRELDRFVGRWRMSGHFVGSDEEAVRGEAEYSWLPGGFFLQQRISLRFGPMAIDGDEVRITVGYGLLDATFTGRFTPDGRFTGGWRPNPGADTSVNVPYDISGARAG